MQESTKSDYVLGTATGYSWAEIYPFVQSLKETGFEGKIVLFIYDTDDLAMECSNLGVDTICIQPQYPFSDRLKSCEISKKCSDAKLHIQSRRFPMYLMFLNSLSSLKGRFLLSDVRDVVFQKSPFFAGFDRDLGASKRIGCVLEERNSLIRDRPINRGWIQGMYGDEILKEIESNPIACSGTIFGHGDSIRELCAQMTDALASRGNSVVGIDQGAYNYLIHCESVSSKKYDNLSGPVSTLGLAPKIELDVNSNVLLESGEIAAIVHQYDRHSSLNKLILAKYAT